MAKEKKKNGLWLKIIVYLGFLALAFWIVNTEYPKILLDKIFPFKLLAVFVAGLLYVSIFTAPVSVALFYLLSFQIDNILVLSAIAGLGAMLGDILILKFFRFFYHEVDQSLSHKFTHKVKQIFSSLHLNILAVVLGAVIIASPFPDELGLILIGATNLSYTRLVVLSFILNTLGILIITSPAYLFLR